MYLVYTTLVVLTVSLLGLLLANTLLRKRIGWQDFTIRTTLLFTIAVPLIVIASSWTAPEGLIQLALQLPNDSISPPESALVDATDEVDHQITNVNADQPSKTSQKSYSVNAQSDQGAVVSQGQKPNATPRETRMGHANTPATNTGGNSLQRLSLGNWMVFGWVIISCLLGSNFLVGWFLVRNLLRQARTCPVISWNNSIRQLRNHMNINCPVSVFASDRITTPLVFGIWRPIILVPAELASLPEDDPRIQAMLAHELAHVQRHDPFWNTLTCLSLMIWWPLPPIYALRRQLIWTREVLCDANGAEHLGVSKYAQSLLDIAVQPQSRMMDPVSLPMNSRSLESRVHWILKNPFAKKTAIPNRRVQILLTVSATLAVLIASTIRFVPVLETNLASAAASPSEHQDPAEATQIIRGKVTDESGATVRGAKVYLHKRGSNRLPRRPLFVEETNAEGQFEFTKLEAGYYQLWAEGEGLTTMDNFLSGVFFQLTEDVDVEDFVLKLHPGCDYDVEVVTAAQKKPIENAKISFGWTDIDREFTTDQNGVAEIRGLASNTWYFVVKAEGFATQFYKAAKQELGTTTKVRFELMPGVKLFGTILDQKDEPVGGVRLSISSDELGMAPNFVRTETDMQGQFECDGLPINHKLVFSSHGDGFDIERREFKIDKFEPLTMEFKAERLGYGGDALFTVVNESGDPVEGALIVNTGTLSSDKIEVTTDAKGKARIEDLRRWVKKEMCRIKVKAPDMVPTEMEFKPGTKFEPANVKVHLQTGHTLRGRLLSPDGDPLPGVWVFPMDSHRGSGPFYSKQVTDKEGRFVARGLPEHGTLTVYTPKEYEWIESLPVQVTDEELEIRATIASIIRLRAIDAKTKLPIPAFNVKVSSVDYELQDESTKRPRRLSTHARNPGFNVHGDTKEFRLEGQQAGTVCKIIVSADGYTSKTIPRMEVVPSDQAKLFDVELQSAK